MTRRTTAAGLVYVKEHGLEDLLTRAVGLRPGQRGRSDRLHHRAPESGEGGGASNTMVAVEKEEKKEEATTAVVPAVTSEFDQALLNAAYKGDLAEVESLLAKGADVKAVSKDMPARGMTPLHWAAEEGHTAIVDTLLAHGADAKAANDLRDTPLHWAAWEGHSDRRRAAKSGRRRDGKEQEGRIAGRPRQGQQAPDNRRKVRPRACQGGGREAEEGLQEATTVHVLSTRFNEPSEEVLAAWYKANAKAKGIKKRSVLRRQIGRGWSATRTTRMASTGMHRSKVCGLDDKLFLEEGKTPQIKHAHRHRGAWHLRLRPEYDQRVHNGLATPTTPTPSGCATGGGRPRECERRRGAGAFKCWLQADRARCRGRRRAWRGVRGPGHQATPRQGVC